MPYCTFNTPKQNQLALHWHFDKRHSAIELCGRTQIDIASAQSTKEEKTLKKNTKENPKKTQKKTQKTILGKPKLPYPLSYALTSGGLMHPDGPQGPQSMGDKRIS